MTLLRRLAASFSPSAAVVGLALGVISLTPSLLPRSMTVQGALTGIAFAVGYGIAQALAGTGRFLGLRGLPRPVGRPLAFLALLALAAVAVFALSQVPAWQNSVRTRMAMDPIESGYPIVVVGVAALTALVLILLARGLLFLFGAAARALTRLLPRRAAILVAGFAVGLVLVLLVNGVLLRALLHGADATFAALDRALDEYIQPPEDDLATGSARSLIAWDDLGRNGKLFVSEGPTQSGIADHLGRQAKQPIRVYAGYHTGTSLEDRARIAREELERVGGFDRSILVVAVPTGTGWLDPSAVDPFEYLHAGDTAIVSMQYSYLPSWLTLMVEPEAAGQAARALFDEVYGAWRALPEERRPAFYLHGLSLGSFGSEASVDFVTTLGAPIQGALWSGPSFLNPIWRRTTARRDPGSPSWRPVFREGATIRFMTQDGFPDHGDAPWDGARIVYLQYASDPMTFFSPSLAFREPDWLGPNRGRDVSPYLDFYPVVTSLQVAFDIPSSTSIPLGYGHRFAPEHYIDAWIAVTRPPAWTAADTALLKEHFEGFDPSPLSVLPDG